VKVGKDRLADSLTGGFRSMGQFALAVKAVDTGGGGESVEQLSMWQKATLSTYGQEQTGTDGGFAVPPEFADQIMVFVEGEDSILSRTDQFPLARNGITFPTDETTPWQTSGGILAAWEGEAGAIAQSKPQLTQKELRLRKLTCLVPVTEELLEDATAMGSYITRKAGEKLDFKVGEAIFRGTGAGQPLGFLNSGGLVSITKVSSQVANTIVGTNILQMWERMYGPYRRNAVWYVNQDAERQLMTMSILGDAGDGGTATTSWGRHIFMPAGGVSGAPYATLFGRPVISTQHCGTVGDQGDVVLADMSQYVTATKSGGVESSSSIHLWFDQDTVAFKFRLRIDGQPWRNTKITPRVGSNTMGAFIVIDARG
jgi:HK97 family phage major capsid protein